MKINNETSSEVSMVVLRDTVTERVKNESERVAVREIESIRCTQLGAHELPATRWRRSIKPHRNSLFVIRIL